jgi:hypothetical protein
MPAIPKGETIIPGNGIGLLGPMALDGLHLKKPSTGRMQRLFRYASRNIGSRATVSALALIGLRLPVGSLHQCGISPHRQWVERYLSAGDYGGL